jgi:hypothetical protein
MVLSLFSMVVSLSSISLSILPSSSCGPMYCPGLSGEGTGSIGRGRNGSGRFGRSKAGSVELGLVFLFQRFDIESVLLRVRIVSFRCFRKSFRRKRCSLETPSNAVLPFRVTKSVTS